MNVLSLFDGISAGRVALERAGITVDKYYASEIDKYAIQIAMKNYPDTIQLGDVTKWRDWDIDWSSIGIVMGGSPCQSWSVAGKKLGAKDERGRLFFVQLEIMQYVLEKSPNAFWLIENVKMKKEFEELLTENVSYQLGKFEKHLINSSLLSAQNRKRLYWTNIPGVTQPEDKGILLKDIVEYGFVDREKGYCLDVCYYKGGNLKQYFEKHRSQLVFSQNIKDENSQSLRRFLKSTKALNEKANCMTATMYKGTASNGVTNIIADYKYRMLTPIECERLQTFEDGYTEGISNTQRYKCLGNSWTVDVIAHILQGIKSKED